MSSRTYDDYRDSGEPWLGEVPAHWESKPLWTFYRRTKRTGFEGEELLSVYRDYGVFPKSSRDDNFNKPSEEVGMANSSAHLIDAGAVVFTRDGARVGLSAITTKPMCVSQHIIAWVCGSRVSNRFLLDVIYAMNAEIYRITAGSTIPTIGMPDVKRMNMPLPPMDEQSAVVDFLVDKRERFATLIGDAERAIELQERRTALVSAAVTGKIDVREFAYQETA